MNQAKPKIRLYVPQPFSPGATLLLEDNQAHYVAHVMRAESGALVAVFNGQDGEWLANVLHLTKKNVALQLISQCYPQRVSPDIWLVCAPIKNKTDVIAEKATELGISQLHIVYTRHSVVRSVNREKLEAHMIEAAEQCERSDIPSLHEHKDLSWLLGVWPKDRTLLYGDESGGGLVIRESFPTLPSGKYGILIGPEGGFSSEEHQLLKGQSFVKACSLGPRILRADTAVVAALACIQAWHGDWHNKPSFAAKE